MAKSFELRQVFGVSRDVPETYVDRQNLDTRFKASLDQQQHIFIYGASKLGKSILRKRRLEDRDTMVIQCTSDMNLENLYAEIQQEIAALEVVEKRTQSMRQHDARLLLGLVFQYLSGSDKRRDSGYEQLKRA